MITLWRVHVFSLILICAHAADRSSGAVYACAHVSASIERNVDSQARLPSSHRHTSVVCWNMRVLMALAFAGF